MIAVQSEGCQPIVRAFEEGAESSRFWEHASTVASGLRVPKPLGDRLTLQAVRESSGCAIAVPDRDIMDAAIRLASEEGIFAAPEGAACVAATERLIREGFLRASDKIVAFDTGSGLKYLEAYSVRFPRLPTEAADKLGGLITPR
jgi:threonine synthase